jgi:ligand-binding sensor domain-containing protein
MKTRFICFAVIVVLRCSPVPAQWVQTNGPYGVDIRCVAPSGPNLFVGTYGSGVYLSANKGASWTAVNTGLPLYKYINTLAVDGPNLFAGTPGGVFVSTNNGTSWSATTGVAGIDVHAFAVSGPNLFAGTWDYGAFLSKDNGRSWTAVNTGLPLDLLTVHSLAASGTTLFAGTEFGVFVSTNNGTSWTAACTGLTNKFILSLAVSGTNLFAGTYEGVFLSTDNGTSWTEVNAGVPVDSHGDYPLVPALAVSGTNVFAGTNGEGVFLSTDNGTSWTEVNAGLPNKYIQDIAVDGTNLYSGSNGSGVWLRPLSEMVTASVGEPSHDVPTTFGLKQNYPNPFNPRTTIEFELPVASQVILSVHDMLGREVSVLVDEKRDAGAHEITFEASGLSSGAYFYRLRAGDFVQTRVCVVLK